MSGPYPDPPEVFTDVPSRSDPDNFSERADLAWASMKACLDWIVVMFGLLQDKLAASIEALQLSGPGVLVGRTTAGAGPSEELTAAQAAALLQGDGLSATAVGYRGIPQRSVSASTTVTAADVGGHIYHPGDDTTPRTWTIPSNAAVALPIGAAVTMVNDVGAGVITIAITSDTLVLSGPGSTGSRTLAAGGMATAVKVGATRWMISGMGLT